MRRLHVVEVRVLCPDLDLLRWPCRGWAYRRLSEVAGGSEHRPHRAPRFGVGLAAWTGPRRVHNARPREETPMLTLRSLLRPTRIVNAHCDIPCGIYDPEQARIEAESCLRIIEKHDASDDKLFRARCIHVKEERAELVKHHLDVLWHDYFKPEHLEKYPD